MQRRRRSEDRRLREVIRLLVPNGLSGVVNYAGIIAETSYASLVREIESIQFVNWHLRNGNLLNAGYREVFMHRIGGGAVAEGWTVASKNTATWEFLEHLFDQGRAEAGGWLKDNFIHIGVKDTMPEE